MTKGIRMLKSLGYIFMKYPEIDKLNRKIVRQFIKYDDYGHITDTINYFYSEENGVEVYTNSIKYGCGSRLDIELLNAIQLNCDELNEFFNLQTNNK